MSTLLSLADVKAHLSELVARVRSHHERFTVTVHGRPAAVLLSVEDLESLEETIDVLSDNAAIADLIGSEAELARGEIVTAEELTAAVATRRRPAS
jgi:antitoxin YefM